jgi:hypothetical protein
MITRQNFIHLRINIQHKSYILLIIVPESNILFKNTQIHLNTCTINFLNSFSSIKKRSNS